jgi:hypothetical protein
VAKRVLPGARHDVGAAREHGIIDASPRPGSTPSPTPPTTRRSGGPGPAASSTPRFDTGRYRRLSAHQKAVNAAHASQRGPGERVNAQLKNWKILRKIRSSPSRAGDLVAAVQTLMIANA